jgi:hypothetical protein
MQQVQLKCEAFQRLQVWDSSDAPGLVSGSGELSLFQIVAQLEQTLSQDGSLNVGTQMAMLQEQAGTRNTRVTKIYGQILARINVAMACIESFESFDAKKDQAINKDPFEVILSQEMSTLIDLINPELSWNVKQLKAKVEKTAEENLAELQNALNQKKHRNANNILQRWKFLEPLSSLAAFESMPGKKAYDAKLEAECERLASEARAAVSSHDKSTKVDKTIASPILRLAKFGSDIPRASICVDPALNRALHAAEAKLGISGMQSLASELRAENPTLGNEIVSSSDAFQTLVIEEFNQKTKRDISAVKNLFAQKNRHIEDGPVWQKYDDFKRSYDSYLQQCIDQLDDSSDPLDWLVQRAKIHVKRDDSASRDTRRFRKNLSHVPGASTLASAASTIGLCSLDDSQEQIPHVLAAIFAWWTMDFYLTLRKRNPDMDANTAKLRHANNGQVICLLRLLGATSGEKN